MQKNFVGERYIFWHTVHHINIWNGTKISEKSYGVTKFCRDVCRENICAIIMFVKIILIILWLVWNLKVKSLRGYGSLLYTFSLIIGFYSHLWLIFRWTSNIRWSTLHCEVTYQQYVTIYWYDRPTTSVYTFCSCVCVFHRAFEPPLSIVLITAYLPSDLSNANLETFTPRPAISVTTIQTSHLLLYISTAALHFLLLPSLLLSLLSISFSLV